MELRQPVGILLFLQIDLMVANVMLGVSESGMYAAIIQFPLLLRTLSGNASGRIFTYDYTLLFKRPTKKGSSVMPIRPSGLTASCSALPAAFLGGLAGPFCRFGSALHSNI